LAMPAAERERTFRRKLERQERREARARRLRSGVGFLPPAPLCACHGLPMVLEPVVPGLPPPPSAQATVYRAPDGSGMAWREPDGTTRVVMVGKGWRG